MNLPDSSRKATETELLQNMLCMFTDALLVFQPLVLWH